MFENCDLDEDGKLTEGEFLQFYKQKAMGMKSDIVWQNLQAHGIGNNLLPEEQDINFNNDLNLTRDQTTLPRCQVANNSEQLDLLFNLDTQLDSSTSDQVWDLLSSLQTNRQLYMNILTNEPQTLSMLADRKILENMPIHKLLYLLQIVKYLVAKILRGEGSSLTDEVLVYIEKPASLNDDVPGNDDNEKGEKSDKQG
jgi:hypothetical protein